MKSLILVKHSVPEVVQDVQAREWVLSDVGKIRAERLADRLVSYQPEIVVSSIEPKAAQTAEIIAQRLGLSVQMIEGLHEHDRSKSPYYSSAEFQQLIQDFFAQPDTLIFGSETAHQALNRFRVAVDHALNLFDNKAVVIVAHGTVISLFVEWLTGCNGYDLWRELDLPSFARIDIQSKQLLEVINLP